MENEGEMYHAAATVSTLLLKLGEVTRRFQNSASKSDTNNEDNSKRKSTTASSNDEKTTDTASPDSQPDESTGNNNNNKSNNDDEWYITFEQLIASLLTDNLLVQYFDAKFNINNKLSDYKSQHA